MESPCNSASALPPFSLLRGTSLFRCLQWLASLPPTTPALASAFIRTVSSRQSAHEIRTEHRSHFRRTATVPTLLHFAAPRHPITHLSQFPTSGWSIHWQRPTSFTLLATSPLRLPAATVTFSKLRSPNTPNTHGPRHTPCTSPVRPSTSQLTHQTPSRRPFSAWERRTVPACSKAHTFHWMSARKYMKSRAVRNGETRKYDTLTTSKRHQICDWDTATRMHPPNDSAFEVVCRAEWSSGDRLQTSWRERCTWDATHRAKRAPEMIPCADCKPSR